MSLFLPSTVDLPVSSTLSAPPTGTLAPGVTSTFPLQSPPGLSDAVRQPAPVTAAVMSAPVEVEPIVLRLDRPFIYTIYDRQTGSILFLGQVMNPAA